MLYAGLVCALTLQVGGARGGSGGGGGSGVCGVLLNAHSCQWLFNPVYCFNVLRRCPYHLQISQQGFYHHWFALYWDVCPHFHGGDCLEHGLSCSFIYDILGPMGFKIVCHGYSGVCYVFGDVMFVVFALLAMFFNCGKTCA